MNRLFTVLMLCAAAALSITATGCGEKTTADSGKIKLTAGLPPIAFIAGRIGGDLTEVTLLLPEGRNPHDFAIGPRDVQSAAASAAFLSCGLAFEKNVARSLAGRGCRVVDVTRNAKLIPMAEHHHHDDDADDEHGDEHSDEHHGEHHGEHAAETFDPHIWLSLDNAAVIADNVRDALVSIAPDKKERFDANCDKLKREFAATKQEITARLAPCRGREFYVYHPAFGYFADMTGLKQEGIELNGREVTPARLVEVIRQARADHVQVIFVQPQFNPASAKALADAIGGKVAPLDPLSADITANVRGMAETLSAGYNTEKSSK